MVQSIYSQTVRMPAPAFSLKDMEGKVVSLSDFKGKVVYVDIWATWCPPCMAEMAYSKPLKEKYKDNPDIVFVNISVDADISKWKKVVTRKKIQGVNLNSLKGMESNILSNYRADYIPKYVLIDRLGNLYESDAKRPSDEGIEDDFQRLLLEK
ncbi:MAG: TlpA family protein disulfide reductase [Cytophagales bacterium]|nr:TlpA family protein disulfide reductase [Cytophagales bacterium]